MASGRQFPRSDAAQPPPLIGKVVAGYAVPVINERAVRAAAGILFLGGVTAFGFAIVTESTTPLRPFGILFIVDLLLRLTAGDGWSPTLALGRLIVRRQQPEWVGASQKEFAWWLGFGLALASCTTIGVLNAPLWISLALCSLCLSLLFIETAFGICLGCTLQSLFSKTAPQYCPGDTCDTDADAAPALTSASTQSVPTPSAL